MNKHITATPESGKKFYMDFHQKGKVVMLNLLKFREKADYTNLENIKPETEISGEEAYEIYMEKTVPEFWIHLRPTTPFRDPQILKDALEMIQQHPEASSLRSGHEAPESPFKWFLKDDEGFFKGLREDLTPQEINLPRQTFSKMYTPNGYVDIVRSSHVLHNTTLHGEKMLVFESPQCVEIDKQEDFEYLKYQILKHGSPMLDYLKNLTKLE